MPVRPAIAFAIAAAAFAQPPADQSRTLFLANTETPQGMQEVATVLRSVAWIRQLSIESASKTLALRGTADQLTLAEWLVHELDQPASGSGSHEYRMPGNDDVVRVFHLAQAQTPQGIQEIQTALRTVADIRMIFGCNAPKALALRGTAGQAALAEWLVEELDPPAPAQTPLMHEYRVPGSADDVVRVFRFAQTQTPQWMQEVQTTIRTLADVRKLFQCNVPRAMALRGTAGQAALAEWLVHELETPAGAQSPTRGQYRVPGGDDVVRVFHLVHTWTPHGIQEIQTAIRTVTDIRRIFQINPVRAVALRGTADQVALSEWLVETLDQPAGSAASAPQDHAVPGSGDVVRVLYVAPSTTPQAFQEIHDAIRTLTGIKLMFPCMTVRALAMRGTAAQLAEAEQLAQRR